MIYFSFLKEFLRSYESQWDRLKCFYEAIQENPRLYIKICSTQSLKIAHCQVANSVAGEDGVKVVGDGDPQGALETEIEVDEKTDEPLSIEAQRREKFVFDFFQWTFKKWQL